MTRREIIGDCELWLGDCREILPELALDVVVTDPPYGIGFKYDGYEDIGGEQYAALLNALTAFPRVVLQYPEEMMKYMVPLWGAPCDCLAWCYNSMNERQFRLWGFWGCEPDWNAAPQEAKNPGDKRINGLVRSYDWIADIQQVKNVSAEKTKHPCQIPTRLAKRILRLAGGDIICDPFLGSGTVGVAAVELGRRFVGIEVDPKYFDIACRRIEDAVSRPDMFIQLEKSERQPSLLDEAAA